MKDFLKKYKWVLFVLALGGAAWLMWVLYRRRVIRFSDNGHATGLNAISAGHGGDGTDIGGNLGFVLNEGHSFKVGDKVTIKQDVGATFPSSDGETVIIGLIGDRVVVTAKAFPGNTPPNPGTIQLA
jgi:hypothetical protein